MAEAAGAAGIGPATSAHWRAGADDLRDEIAAAVRLLHPEPGDVVELRVLGAGQWGVVAGHFEDPDALAATAERYDGAALGLYVTVQRLTPETLIKYGAANKVRVRARAGTLSTDADVERYRWLPIDLDPERPDKGTSSSDAEQAAAIERGQAIAAWLVEEIGFPVSSVVRAASGNGAHTLARIDVPADDEGRALVKQALYAIAARFSDDAVRVDTTPHNPARIWRLYGTRAMKGEATAERPHRRSRILERPAVVTVAPRAALERLAALAPEPVNAPRDYGTATGRWSDALLGRAMQHAGRVLFEIEDGKAAVVCPWRHLHSDQPGSRTGSVVFAASEGHTLGAFHCSHDHCSERTWRDVLAALPREAVERARAEIEPHETGGGATAGVDGGSFAPPRALAMPTLAEPALAGLAGDVVRAFRAHLEAADAAILFQFLAGFGSLVGRRPYFAVGETRHHANEFVLLVGRTARARKGDSRHAALRTLSIADDTWRPASGLSTGEGLIHAVRDEVRRPNKDGEETVVDAGVSDKRLCAVESEFARTLRAMAREHNTLSATLRDAWDGLSTLRTMSKGTPEVATDAHVSVIAHATVADLDKHLSSTDCANGFGNRFILAFVERVRLVPDPEPVAQDVLDALAARVRAALEAAQGRGRIERTAAAAILWRRIYPALTRDHPGLLGDMLARSEGHVARLSLLYALLDKAEAIDVAHLRSALAAWEFAEASARVVFAGRSGSADADRIAAAMRPGAELTRSELSAVFGRNVEAARLDAAVALLVATGAYAIKRRPGDQGRTVEVLRRLKADETPEQGAAGA